MKKIIIALFIIVVILLSQVPKSNEVIIPQESIRYRIIANSNSVEDQDFKEKINAEIEPVINEILTSSTSLETTRQKITNIIPEIEKKLNNYTTDYKINFGNNYFPEKNYYGVMYPAGNYESLVITLGKGQGDNWWCVLFPPLCLLEIEKDNLKDVEYTFFVKKIIEKFH